MRKYKTRITVILVAFIVIGCGYSVEEEIVPRVPTEILAATIDDFPSGWRIVEGSPQPMDRSEGSKRDTTSFYIYSGNKMSAYHDVWHFKNQQDSQMFFETSSKSIFNDNSVGVAGSWEEPSDWSFDKSQAQKLRVGCNINTIADHNTACSATWLYDEYVSVFSLVFDSVIDAEDEKFNQFEEIVQMIDARFEAHLRD